MNFSKRMRELVEILKSLLIFLLFVFVLILIGCIYKYHEKIYPSTNDATLQADIIPISTNISGRVDQVFVANNTEVQENQILFTLDSTQENLAHQKALANTKQNTDNYQRYLKIAQFTSGQALEAAQVAMQTSKANVASTKYSLDNTIIRAPRAGIITNFHLEKGEYLTPTTHVAALIIKHSAWVQANILEPFLENIRVGQAATFEFRMYPGIKFFGIVQDIGYGIETNPQTGNTLPYVDPNFNWVYLSKRFPVRIKVLSEDPFKTTPFRVGATVDVIIDTKKYVKNITVN